MSDRLAGRQMSFSNNRWTFQGAGSCSSVFSNDFLEVRSVSIRYFFKRSSLEGRHSRIAGQNDWLRFAIASASEEHLSGLITR